MRTFIDLFSGAGLFSAGMVAGGFKPRLAIDANAHAVATYNRNVANVAVSTDVKELIEGLRTDVLIAGPPCQGFSTLGSRDPRDIRNRLCLAITHWAESTRAPLVIVENVPPFLASSQWRRMADGFDKLGYQIETWTLNAADFGTPQQRLRSFTIASKIGLPQKPKPGDRAFSASAFRRTKQGDPMHVWPSPTAAAARRIALIPACGDRRDLVESRPDICPPSWFKLGCQATDVWGRIDPSRPANTLKTRFQNPSTGRYLHPSEDRVISLREAARLQGLPDNWVFVGNRESIVRQIGNGVPLPLGRAIAKQIDELFARKRSRSRSAAA